MRTSLTLYHQGLILFSFLLVVELVFCATLICIMRDAEQEARKYEHSMEVIKQANTLLKSYTDGAAILAFYAATGSETYKARYETSIHDIDEQKENLKRIFKNDPKSLVELEDFERLLDQTGNAMLEYKSQIDSGHADLGQLRRNAMPRMKAAMSALKYVSDNQWAEAEAAYPKSSTVMRDRVFIVVCIGIAFNIAFVIGALRFFRNFITRRIDLLADNSMRLASGAPLNPRLKGNDELSYVDGVFHNMAEVLDEANKQQQAATEAIKESEEQVRMLVEHMPVGLIAIDQVGTIQSANPRTENIFGYGKTDLLGKNLQLLFPDANYEEPQAFMQMLRQRAFGKTYEISAQRKNAQTFPSDIAVDEIQTKNGVQLLVNVQDVTDRHEAERLKREFVAMVSHDLRTPLTSLLGSLTLLSHGAMGELPEEAHSTVTTAEADVERLMRLINDLLDVARIEAGKMEMVFDNVAVGSIITQSIDSVRAFADQNQISIQAQPTGARVLADGDRLVQVMVNLLSNAVKFSPPRSAVEVSVNELPGWIEIRIQDHGRGVPEKYRDAIFERFQQVETEDARGKKGTGLGLPICKTIIEQHGGTIGVRSGDNGGSTFWFRLQALPVTAPS